MFQHVYSLGSGTNSNTKKKTKCILVDCSLSPVLPREQSWMLATLGVQ